MANNFGLIAGFQFRLNGLIAYSAGTILESLTAINIFAFVFAYLFWVLPGKKKDGGTITFTIFSIFCMVSVFGHIFQNESIGQRQPPSYWRP